MNDARQLTVILRPPREVTTADDVVEEEADEAPGDVVGGCRWRDETRSAKDDGEVNVTDEAALPLQLDEILRERTKEADEEEEHEAVVDLALRELARGADDTPDDGSGAEDLRRRADEAVFLVWAANIVDVGEHPCLYAELDCAGDDSRDDLAEEHGARTA